jgi:hypothetical protein
MSDVLQCPYCELRFSTHHMGRQPTTAWLNSSQGTRSKLDPMMSHCYGVVVPSLLTTAMLRLPDQRTTAMATAATRR